MDKQKTDVEWIDQQDWGVLAGSQVFLLIERHAEGWEEISIAMEAWLNARTRATMAGESDIRQLLVLQDIRAAIGDDGKLMQSELVDAIKNLRERNLRYGVLVGELSKSLYPDDPLWNDIKEIES